MRREEFLKTLKRHARQLPSHEREEILFYYDEMIRDAVENGKDEERFIAEIGHPSAIIEKTADDKLMKKSIYQKNKTSLLSALGATLSIVANIAMYFIFFVTLIVCVSFIIAGGAIVFNAMMMAYVSYVEAGAFEWGYFLAFLSLGSGLIVVSVGLIGFFAKNRAWLSNKIYRFFENFNRKEA